MACAPLERRQQRGMNIDDPVAVRLQHHIGKDAHIPRQTDQLDPFGPKPADDLPFVVGFRRVLFGVERKSRNTVTGSPLVHESPRLVADHEGDAGRNAPIGTSRSQCFEVGAVSAGEYCDRLHRPIGFPRPDDPSPGRSPKLSRPVSPKWQSLRKPHPAKPRSPYRYPC